MRKQIDLQKQTKLFTFTNDNHARSEPNSPSEPKVKQTSTNERLSGVVSRRGRACSISLNLISNLAPPPRELLQQPPQGQTRPLNAPRPKRIFYTRDNSRCVHYESGQLNSPHVEKKPSRTESDNFVFSTPPPQCFSHLKTTAAHPCT